MPLKKIFRRAKKAKKKIASKVNVVKQVAKQAQGIAGKAKAMQAKIMDNPLASPAMKKAFQAANSGLKGKIQEAKKIQKTIQSVGDAAQALKGDAKGTILAAVGRGAANLPQDVLNIKAKLTQKLGVKLPMTAVLDPKTLATLQDVSRRVGQTWQAAKNFDPKSEVTNWLNSSKGLPDLPTGPQIDAIRDKVNAVVPIPPKVDELINKGKDFLDKARPAYEKANEMVKDAKEHGVVGAVGIQANKVAIDKVAEFMDKHLPYDKTFLDFDKNITASFGIFQFKAGAKANVRAKIVGTRKDTKITCTASLSASVSIYASVGFGFKINVLLASVDIGASIGLSAGAELKAQASISLEANGPTIAGTMNPFTTDLTVTLKGFIEIRAKGRVLFWKKNFGPKAAKWLAKKIKGRAEGNRVVYDIGRVQLLRITSPSYSLSFDWSKQKFSTRATKKWSIERHPSVKGKLGKVFKKKY